MSQYLFSHFGSKTESADKNSCAVFALEHAFDMSKEDATEYCALYGRKEHAGMVALKFAKMVQYLGAELRGYYGTTQAAIELRTFSNRDAKKYKGISIGTISRCLTKGTFILYITGHFTVIKDGKLLDPNPHIKAGTSVIAVWEVKNVGPM